MEEKSEFALDFRLCAQAFKRKVELLTFSRPNFSRLGDIPLGIGKFRAVADILLTNHADHILLVAGSDPQGLSLILKEMSEDERRKMFFDLFSSLSERVNDEDTPNEAILAFTGVLKALCLAFNIEPEMRLEMFGGETIEIQFWPELERRVRESWKV